MKLFCKSITTPLGPMLLAANDDGLAGLWFTRQRNHPDQSSWQSVTMQRWLDQAEAEVQAYFCGERRHFETPRCALWGTPFQRSVWDALATIPWGATTTYGMLATQLHKPLASRAVGAAVGRNPWSIIVPCHRVLGCDRSLTGYAGGLERKLDLLRREKVMQEAIAPQTDLFGCRN
jgi:methylated-DNA-[protein]-cysteine S-methyltransferase